VALSVSQAVWDKSRATGATLLVLLALADHANDDGVCWPSARRLGRMARISRRHVFRCLDRLVHELGEVERLGLTNTSRLTTRYRVALRGGDAPVTSDASVPGDASVASDWEVTPRMTRQSPGGCPPRQPSGDPAGTRIIKEPPIETSSESSGRKGEENAPRAPRATPLPPGAESPPAGDPDPGPGGGGTGGPAAAAAVGAVADPHELMHAWNEHASHLVPCHDMTPTRLKLARARIAERPALAEWVRIFQTMDASPFLRGANQGRWRPNLDWALKPETGLRVLEGQYDVAPDPQAAAKATGAPLAPRAAWRRRR
jgi:hypothetical protein